MECIDGAVRAIPGTSLFLRTDLSATLFLSEPAEYDGGELVVFDTYGKHEIKLPAGDLILYLSGSRHRVNPVTRAENLRRVLDPEHGSGRAASRAAIRPRFDDTCATRQARRVGRDRGADLPTITICCDCYRDLNPGAAARRYPC